MGLFTIETILFKQVIEKVSKHSALYRKSVAIHLHSVNKEMEHDLLQMWVTRFLYDGGLVTSKLDQVQVSRMYKFENEFIKRVKQHIQFLYSLLAQTKNEDKVEKYQNEVVIMTLYKTLVEHNKWGMSSLLVRERLNGHLGASQHHIRHFMAFWNQSIAFHEYEDEMETVKRNIARKTRLMNSVLWADVCFAHLILLKLVKSPEPPIFSSTLYEQAMRIYTIHNHNRGKLLTEVYTKLGTFLWPDFDNANIQKQCNMFWLIRNAPRVKSLIRLGVSSVERFDVCDQHDYWNQ
jgi:hypothetical protein